MDLVHTMNHHLVNSHVNTVPTHSINLIDVQPVPNGIHATNNVNLSDIQTMNTVNVTPYHNTINEIHGCLPYNTIPMPVINIPTHNPIYDFNPPLHPSS